MSPDSAVGQPPIGSSYSLFEVAHHTFTSSVSDPHNKQEVASAPHAVNYTGMCGPLDFVGGPAPGVAIIPPVGVQWKPGTGTFPFAMKVVDNSLNKAVKSRPTSSRRTHDDVTPTW